jgi:primosomal protein N' (replication factor Y)
MAPAPKMYAEILLPLALENVYTYEIPESLQGQVSFGKRVEVQFGTKKRYAGLVVNNNAPTPTHRTKPIISVLDPAPIIHSWQYKLWKWMADYYCCTLGEIMRAALPGAYQLSSETIIKSMMHIDEDRVLQLGEPLYTIFRLIQPREAITLDELEHLSGLTVLYPHIVALYQLGFILVIEALEEKYTPKQIRLVQLADPYRDEQGMKRALDELANSEKQERLILSYLSMASKTLEPVEPKILLEKAEINKSVLDTLIRKGIFQEVFKEINRMDRYAGDVVSPAAELTTLQLQTLAQIKTSWHSHEVVLLHGITGSGKTLIYTELIKEAIDRGQQVLYLVPEIGLSVQILKRLQHLFGDKITISHSRLTDNERVDLWHKVQQGIPIVAGVRSSIFLPFTNLGLIIVDEEHDASYKQQDPNPRYQARDMAILLGKEHKAQVLLGSATPSIESYFHAMNGKYGHAKLMERYLGMELPLIQLIDRRKDRSAEGVMYSHSLIDAIKQTLAEKKQVILYKNRRGYAPVLKCGVCAWVAECDQCDIALTYHKARNVLVCHMCGSVKPVLAICPACGSPRLMFEGYGTEKIEDELQLIFPEAKIRRMDLDTTRGKNAMEGLIYEFEKGAIDILVGTQMVTKGLDFDHVGLVGVIYADQAMHYPDFRAAERTFQTLVQVSGRAGRKHKQGVVMIQTYQPDHPIFTDVVNSDYASFFKREIAEREAFVYPPFVRQIAVTVRHKQFETSREAADLLAMQLKKVFGHRVLGPSVPTIGRVRNQYIHLVHLKIEKEGKVLHAVKHALREFQTGIVKKKMLSTVRVSIDVDPQQ